MYCENGLSVLNRVYNFVWVCQLPVRLIWFSGRMLRLYHRYTKAMTITGLNREPGNHDSLVFLPKLSNGKLSVLSNWVNCKQFARLSPIWNDITWSKIYSAISKFSEEGEKPHSMQYEKSLKLFLINHGRDQWTLLHDDSCFYLTNVIWKRPWPTIALFCSSFIKYVFPCLFSILVSLLQ